MLGWLIVLIYFKVLSSKLMPTADDDMARNCAKSFCENFLKAGGLRLVSQYNVTWIAENNSILFINFSCQALLIPTRYYVKHYESFNKKEWCLSLWNILICFMIFDYLKNLEKHVSFRSGSGGVSGRGKVKRLNRFLLIPTSIYAKANLIPSSPCCGRH